MSNLDKIAVIMSLMDETHRSTLLEMLNEQEKIRIIDLISSNQQAMQISEQEKKQILTEFMNRVQTVAKNTQNDT